MKYIVTGPFVIEELQAPVTLERALQKAEEYAQSWAKSKSPVSMRLSTDKHPVEYCYGFYVGEGGDPIDPCKDETHGGGCEWKEVCRVVHQESYLPSLDLSDNRRWLLYFGVKGIDEITQSGKFEEMCRLIKQTHQEDVIFYQLASGELWLHSEKSAWCYLDPGGFCMRVRTIFPVEQDVTPPQIGKDGVIAAKPYDPERPFLWLVARDLGNEFVTHIYNGGKGCRGYGHGHYVSKYEDVIESFKYRTNA